MDFHYRRVEREDNIPKGVIVLHIEVHLGLCDILNEDEDEWIEGWVVTEAGGQRRFLKSLYEERLLLLCIGL